MKVTFRTIPQGPPTPMACPHPATIPDQRGEETCQSCGAYVGAYVWPVQPTEQPRKANQ